MAAWKVKLPPERSVRLTAGLIMFTYAACHFLSHATGIFLADTLQAVGHDILLAPWRTPVGLSILLASFLTHLGLGLRALFRRRHLRISAIEAWQLGLGLIIPLLLFPHVTDARLGVTLYGLEDSYFRVLYLFWLTEPGTALPRQFALLLAVWIHGSIGIHMWLRFRSWYRRTMPWFAAADVALPLLAVLGIINAGWNTVLRAAVEPGFTQAHGPPVPGSANAAAAAALGDIVTWLQLGYVVLVAAVVFARFWRGQVERRSAGIRIDYRDGRQVTVPRGFSILEASRWARIPHAAVCGGRGRCSTCRVRVTKGLDRLPPPQTAEMRTLKRIGAPPGVRLACQVRPVSALAVMPLVPIGRPLDGLRVQLDEGRELLLTAVFTDLRDSTSLAAGRLPFDAIFIVDRYIQAVTGAIHRCRGHVTSIAGDGIMSVFGVDGDGARGARDALAAASAIWGAIEEVSRDLAADIGTPLRFGIGVHSGVAVIGAVGPVDQAAVHFLGDVGNVASRLESLTKELDCTLIVSSATLAMSGLDRSQWERIEAPIRGRDEGTLVVFRFQRLDDIVFAS